VETNLKSRLITALIAIPLLILIVGWGDPWLFAGFLFLVSLIALREYFTMVFPARVTKQLLGIFLGAGLSLLLIFSARPEIEFYLTLFLFFGVPSYLFMAEALEERLKFFCWTLLGAFYVGYLLPYWVVLFRLPDGRSWVFFVLLVIMTGDTVAYFVGRRFGRRKLAPDLSPGKTVEGALGYLVGSVVTGFIGGRFLVPQLAGVEVVGLAGLLGVLGQIGDLFESLIKRVFSMKESGNLLPGHGGLLDRLDSLIFPAVFTTAYLRLFHS
jgi:phosphatidate cytidylyltransferase